MHAVLDVAYPGSEVIRRTLPARRWEEVGAELAAQGIEVVDVRKGEA